MYDLDTINKINAEGAPDKPIGADIKIQKPKRKVVPINEKRPDANPNPDTAA